MFFTLIWADALTAAGGTWFYAVEAYLDTPTVLDVHIAWKLVAQIIGRAITLSPQRYL